MVEELVPASLDGERVDRVLSLMTGLPRAVAARMVAGNGVEVDGKPLKTRGQKVAEGQLLRFVMPDELDVVVEAEPDVAFDVIYSDEHLIIVDKPEGLVVHPGNGHSDGTLVNGLLARFADMADTMPGDPSRPGIVHRLDAGTSGLLVVARTQDAYDKLVSMMRDRSVARRYLTLVWGDLQPDRGMIDAPIGRSSRTRTKMAVSHKGKVARTGYEVIRRRVDPNLSLVKVQLETGRTHQIRVHMEAIGHAVVGDQRYNGVRQGVECRRPFLHAAELEFDHPITGEHVSFSSPLPADLHKVLKKLDLDLSGELSDDL